MTGWQLYSSMAQLLAGTNLPQHIDAANKQDLWPALLPLSSQSLVTSNLYWALANNADAWQQLPNEPKDYLTGIFELNCERNEQLSKQAWEFIEACNKQNITPLILKNTGEILAERTPHIGYRMQTDIDILVAPEELRDAQGICRDLGYEIAEEFTQRGQAMLRRAKPEQSTSIQASYQLHQHTAPLIRKGDRAVLELHRHAYSRRFQKRFNLDQLLASSELISSPNGSFRVMSVEQRQYHLVYHSYLGEGMNWRFDISLRNACDWLTLPPAKLPTDDAINRYNQQIQNIFTQTSASRRSPKWLQRRHNHPTLANIIDIAATLRLAIVNLRHNPGKLVKRWNLLWS